MLRTEAQRASSAKPLTQPTFLVMLNAVKQL